MHADMLWSVRDFLALSYKGELSDDHVEYVNDERLARGANSLTSIVAAELERFRAINGGERVLTTACRRLRSSHRVSGS